MRLTKEMIDNVFEPRRSVVPAMDLKGLVGRLLMDKRGHYHAITRERNGRELEYHWNVLSRRHDYGYGPPLKGHFPVWLSSRIESQVDIHEDHWEVLPGPSSPSDYIIGLYKLVFPQWDSIVKIDGWPAVNPETAQYMCRKCMEWDDLHHVTSMHGGAWLQHGFSQDGTVLPWQVSLKGVRVAYTDTPFRYDIRRRTFEDDQTGVWYFYYIAYKVWFDDLSEDVQPEGNGYRFPCFQAAVERCEKDCGQRLTLTPEPLENTMLGDSRWMSNVVRKMKEAA